MVNIFNKLALDAKTSNFVFEIKRVISIIEEYNLLHKEFQKENPSYFKKEKDGATLYDFFVDNLHIHVQTSDEEKIYSIRLKFSNEEWQFSEDDYSHPLNDTFEVYLNYDIPVLDITRTSGMFYKHGSWDKYVLKTLRSFFHSAKAFTTESKFEMDYRKVKSKVKFTFAEN